jgi:hypothetical protein
VLSGNERISRRGKHQLVKASRKTEHAKSKKYESDSDNSYGAESLKKSTVSRRHAKSKKHGNFEVTTSQSGFRNQGLKININMKGLDKNSLGSDKGYP